MSIETFAALVVFAFVTSVTPGPNNFMLLASGVNFGFRRTLPHMCGIAVGFWSLLIGVGFGLGSLIAVMPSLELGLKVVGGAYLLYLAWRIATSRSLGAGGTATDGARAARPMSFLAAATFQWVNPKAWVMAITSMAIYADASAPVMSVLIVAFAFALVNFPSVSVWAGFGQVLSRWLADPVRLKWFNIAMGCALALTLAGMLA